MSNPRAKTRLSIALLMAWTACNAATFAFYREAASQSASHPPSGAGKTLVYFYYAIWAVAVGTQLTAALVRYLQPASDPSRDNWQPGMWLLPIVASEIPRLSAWVHCLATARCLAVRQGDTVD